MANSNQTDYEDKVKNVNIKKSDGELLGTEVYDPQMNHLNSDMMMKELKGEDVIVHCQSISAREESLGLISCRGCPNLTQTMMIPPNAEISTLRPDDQNTTFNAPITVSPFPNSDLYPSDLMLQMEIPYQ